MEELLRRGGGLAEGVVDGLPAATGLEALDERQPGRVRKEERFAEHGRHLIEDLGVRGVQRFAEHLERLGLGQVGGRPVRHDQGGVALHERQPGDASVAVPDLVEREALQVEVLVLERMRVFVGERDLLGRPDGPGLRDDVELLVIGVVEAGHLAAEQLDVEILE
jgi:hypothetical protein